MAGEDLGAEGKNTLQQGKGFIKSAFNFSVKGLMIYGATAAVCAGAEAAAPGSGLGSVAWNTITSSGSDILSGLPDVLKSTTVTVGSLADGASSLAEMLPSDP